MFHVFDCVHIVDDLSDFLRCFGDVIELTFELFNEMFLSFIGRFEVADEFLLLVKTLL